MAKSPESFLHPDYVKLPSPSNKDVVGSRIRARIGFSLIELLVVIAIIGLLAGLALPAISSIGQSRGIANAAYQIADAIELARNEAITRQTYVWMGVQPVTEAGSSSLFVGMVYSKDGSGTNTSAANLQPVGKPILLQSVGMADPSSLSVGTNLGTLKDFSSVSDGLSFSIGRMTNSSRQSITFTPMGEAVLKSAPDSTTGFEPRIGIGMSQSRGTNLVQENSVVVVIDGSVGSPTIYRK